MATQSLSVSISGSLSLVDSDGNQVLSFSPSFSTDSTTVDYPIAVKPDGDVIADLKPGECMFAPLNLDGAANDSANLDIAATTAAQKVQYLLCDGADLGLSDDD